MSEELKTETTQECCNEQAPATKCCARKKPCKWIAIGVVVAVVVAVVVFVL